MDDAGHDGGLDELIERIGRDMDRAFAHMRRPLGIPVPGEPGPISQDDEPPRADGEEPRRSEAA